MIGTKSRRGVVLLSALLVTLAITGSLFAYAYSTTSITMTVTGGTTDFADVYTDTSENYTVLGKFRGAISAHTIFHYDTYSGSPDVEVQVYLANPEELSNDYSFWMLRLVTSDNAGYGAPMDMEGITKVLSLNNPVVTFTSDNTVAYTSYIYSPGGAYRSFPSSWITPEQPLIFCQVVQRS